MIDAEWTRRLQETKGLADQELDKIFQKMDDILMDRFPLIVRRMEYERLRKDAHELPSAFIERVFSSSYQAQLDDASLVSRVLVKVIASLGTDTLNKTRVCNELETEQDEIDTRQYIEVEKLISSL